MRASFWKGVIAGGILGATISMMVGGRHKKEKIDLSGYSPKMVKSRAHKVLRGMSKTVNDLIK
ncbi:MAG TPA: hypothetical protein PK728_05410 [Bacillota bacterium]|nr:hypothetical protein [Bacillota bacterium]